MEARYSIDSAVLNDPSSSYIVPISDQALVYKFSGYAQKENCCRMTLIPQDIVGMIGQYLKKGNFFKFCEYHIVVPILPSEINPPNPLVNSVEGEMLKTLLDENKTVEELREQFPNPLYFSLDLCSAMLQYYETMLSDQRVLNRAMGSLTNLIFERIQRYRPPYGDIVIKGITLEQKKLLSLEFKALFKKVFPNQKFNFCSQLASDPVDKFISLIKDPDSFFLNERSDTYENSRDKIAYMCHSEDHKKLVLEDICSRNPPDTAKYILDHRKGSW